MLLRSYDPTHVCFLRTNLERFLSLFQPRGGPLPTDAASMNILGLFSTHLKRFISPSTVFRGKNVSRGESRGPTDFLSSRFSGDGYLVSPLIIRRCTSGFVSRFFVPVPSRLDPSLQFPPPPSRPCGACVVVCRHISQNMSFRPPETIRPWRGYHV